MRYLIILFCVTLFSGTVLAQSLTKEEKKQLIQEIKQLKKDPMKYKYMKQSIEVKDVIIAEQTNEIGNINRQAQKNQLELLSARDSISFLISQLVEAEKAADCTPNTDGEKYRIQIGLFRDFDFTDMLNEPKYIMYEKVDELFRYSIGNFETEAAAQAFKSEIKKLGIKGAFVSKYFDNERVNK